MKLLILLCSLIVIFTASAQPDTLAFQDFEVVPEAPVWSFTGPVVYNSGYSSASAAPPNSPLGIGGSRAWETTTNSLGLVLDFANTVIPTGYDTIRVRFNLAALNLTGPTGGPDNLDFVLIAYSTDGGSNYVDRMRIRGAALDNSFWGYDATGVANVSYLPATETMFQPSNTGLQTTLGYSTCEIVFPGSAVSQIAFRITVRSSSSTDTWMIDNLVMTGEMNCQTTYATVTETACESYDWAQNGETYTASGLYTDTIPNAAGCDSIVTLDLTINGPTYSTVTVSACDVYTWSQTGENYTTTGLYSDTIVNAAGCDSIVTLDLTMHSGSLTIQNEVACGSYTWAENGQTYTQSGNYTVTLQTVHGCDSIITLDLYVGNQPTAQIIDDGLGTLTGVAAGSFVGTWIDCSTGLAIASSLGSPTFTPTVNGTYAVQMYDSISTCPDTSECYEIDYLGMSDNSLIAAAIFPNPATDAVTITFAGTHAELAVFDAKGKLLQRTVVENNTLFRLEGFEKGVYFFELSTNTGRATVKIAKE